MKKIAKKSAGRKASVWTKEKKAQFKKLYASKENKELAEFFDCSVNAIKQQAREQGLKKEKYFWTEKEKSYILNNWQKMSATEIANKLGRTRWAVTSKYNSLTKKKKVYAKPKGSA